MRECDLHDGRVAEIPPATHTFYTDLNTMSWCCDECAQDLLRNVRMHPEEWTGCRLVPTIEETDPERKERLKRTNLLQGVMMLRLVS